MDSSRALRPRSAQFKLQHYPVQDPNTDYNITRHKIQTQITTLPGTRSKHKLHYPVQDPNTQITTLPGTRSKHTDYNITQYKIQTHRLHYPVQDPNTNYNITRHKIQTHRLQHYPVQDPNTQITTLPGTRPKHKLQHYPVQDPKTRKIQPNADVTLAHTKNWKRIRIKTVCIHHRFALCLLLEKGVIIM